MLKSQRNTNFSYCWSICVPAKRVFRENFSYSWQNKSNSRQNREKWMKNPVCSSKCPESVAIVVIELHWVVFLRFRIILSVFNWSEKKGNNVAIFLRFSVAFFFRCVAVISDGKHSLIFALSPCESPNMVRFRAKIRGTEWKSRYWSRLISEKWSKIRAKVRVEIFWSSGGYLEPPADFCVLCAVHEIFIRASESHWKTHSDLLPIPSRLSPTFVDEWLRQKISW